MDFWLTNYNDILLYNNYNSAIMFDSIRLLVVIIITVLLLIIILRAAEAA